MVKEYHFIMAAKTFKMTAAGKAELENFEKVFSKNQIPDEMPEFTWAQLSADPNGDNLVNLMAASKLFPSKKEARRLVEQGAVKIESQRISDPQFVVVRPENSIVIQAGKRIFFRVKAK